MEKMVTATILIRDDGAGSLHSLRSAWKRDAFAVKIVSTGAHLATILGAAAFLATRSFLFLVRQAVPFAAGRSRHVDPISVGN